MHQKENSYIKAFESKVIMYLFEDVMKMRPENIFIGHHKKNGKMIFSEICKAFEQDGEGIFGMSHLSGVSEPRFRFILSRHSGHDEPLVL